MSKDRDHLLKLSADLLGLEPLDGSPYKVDPQVKDALGKIGLSLALIPFSYLMPILLGKKESLTKSEITQLADDINKVNNLIIALDMSLEVSDSE